MNRLSIAESFFPRGVLDEILNLIESVSEEFPSYSTIFVSFICFLLPGDLHSELILSSLQLVLCRVAAVKRLPAHHRSAEYLFTGPLDHWAHFELV